MHNSNKRSDSFNFKESKLSIVGWLACVSEYLDASIWRFVCVHNVVSPR